MAGLWFLLFSAIYTLAARKYVWCVTVEFIKYVVAELYFILYLFVLEYKQRVTYTLL